MGGGIPELSYENTFALLVHKGIELASEMGKGFDFEGSMIPGVANYNMKFNSSKENYFLISDCSDKYRFFSGLRESSQALKRLIKGAGKNNV